jgi:hypothetical protein
MEEGPRATENSVRDNGANRVNDFISHFRFLVIGEESARSYRRSQQCCGKQQLNKAAVLETNSIFRPIK